MCNLSRPSGAGLRVVMGIAQPGVREDELLTLYCLTVEDHQPKIQALLARNEVLAQQNERLKSFTGIVAHDLANALQTVATGITMLQPQLSDSLSTNDRQKFHRIAQASQAMRDILSGMMMYLRFEIGEYPMELTSLNALVDTIITSTIEPPGKTLSIRRCAELPALVCERHLIEELFRNVVGNSIKYCDKEQIEIEIGLEPAFGPDPVFFIRDNGVGIHENDLTRVFEPFCRADRQGLNVSGNGMGMMLVQSIVTRHGGAVWLESTVHLGTTVRFSLSTQPQARI